MEITTRELAVALRPFNTETARRVCYSLIRGDHIFPQCIEKDGFIRLELPCGKSAESSFESVAALQEWKDYLPAMSDLEEKAFDEAKPEALKKDLERLFRALVKTRDLKWRHAADSTQGSL